ncbi:hypothetical protein BDY21DRAFT_366222 [Lineolata rhizophorae]|uniref:rRNA biogenesis protein RRP36 n=1 Tax=Lineolata rhizophorae TaxID=578093 RepID=A0A6A6NT62_9PEZI|nr:hypothetical protein BDY21DRAFT_366222 [Lineolata rhizophorae]
MAKSRSKNPANVPRSRAPVSASDSPPQPHSSDEFEGSSPSILDTGGAGEGQGIRSDDGSYSDGKWDDMESNANTENGDEGLDSSPSYEEDQDDEDQQGAETDVQVQMSKVSFSALAKAQKALDSRRGEGIQRKRKRFESGGEDDGTEDKLAALRERLRELKRQKKSTTGLVGQDSSGRSKKAERGKPGDKAAESAANDASRQRRRKSTQAATLESDGGHSSSSSKTDSETDSDASTSANKKTRRTSKHAPAVQTSTRPVPRARTAVSAPKKRPARDPRFSSLSAGPLDRATVARRYEFLDTYRAGELAELKGALAAAARNPRADPAETAALERALRREESRAAERERRKRVEEVERKHKREERKKVEELGKRPFYLKRSEVRKRALVEKWEGMKGKERERAVERRRKKLAAKERKGMPGVRRGGSEQ